MKSAEFLLLPLILAFMSPAFAADLPQSVPEVWREEVFADTSNNIAGRAKETLDVIDRQVVPVFVFDVPVEDVRTQNSKYLTPEELAKFFVVKDGRTFLRTYLPGINQNFKNALSRLKRKYGEPSQTIAGFRIQGKATYHVWDPAEGEDQAFRLKLPFYAEGSEGGLIHHNDYDCGAAAVRMNDYLTEIEQRSAIPGATFYREVFAAEVKGLGTKLNFLIRRPPRSAFERAPDRSFLPLHGAISSTHLLDWAAAMQKTPAAWINDEFIPKLAEFMAQLNFKWGVFIEAHSQNLSLLVDRRTGRILGFYFKDLFDVMVSPFLQAANGLMPVYEQRPQAVLMEDWITNHADTEYPGVFAHDFLLQTIADWTKDKKAARIATGIYLKKYKDAIKPTGLTIENKHILELMLKGKRPLVEYTFNPKALVPRDNLDDYHAAFAAIVDDLFTWSGNAKLFLANYPELARTQVPLDVETKLEKLFREQMEKNLVSWSFKQGASYYSQYIREKFQLRWVPVRNGVVVAGQYGFVMGMAYGFTGESLAYINEQAKLAGLFERRAGGPCQDILANDIPQFTFSARPKKPKD